MTSNALSSVLVLGGTGKTGRRIVERLTARGVPTRVGSRSGQPPFDWDDRTTWEPALAGAQAVYLCFHPDLAVPGAAGTVGALARLAVAQGARRLVLLSGRGEPEAQQAEGEVRAAGTDFTVLRSSWFDQNFSESFLLDGVLAGSVELPVDGVREPFVDADDVADVAVAALTELDRHGGATYELTGPESLTFAEAVRQIAAGTGRQVGFTSVPPAEYAEQLRGLEIPDEVIGLMSYLFTEVLDGRNTTPAGGVEQVLGRPPTPFRDYVRRAAAAGAWT